MGEKDLAEKSLLVHADVFADSVNALLYGGEAHLKVEDLQAAPTETVYPDSAGLLRNQFQDVSKYVMCEEGIRAQYILENQTEPDKGMVLRKAGYQGAIYRGEYREQQLYPVVGVVLYWGEKQWNFPQRLRELMQKKLADEEMNYVDEVQLHVYEMAHLPQEVRERFKSDMRIVVDYLAEGKKYISVHRKVIHVEDLLRVLRALSGDDRYLDILHSLTEEEKEEGCYMCEVLDRYWNGGVAEGISQGIVSSVRGMREHDLREEQIAILINQKISYIQNIVRLLELHPDDDDAAIAKRLLVD